MITTYCNHVFTKSCNMILNDFKEISFMIIKNSNHSKEVQQVKNRYNEVKKLMISKNQKIKILENKKKTNEVNVYQINTSTSFLLNQNDYVKLY